VFLMVQRISALSWVPMGANNTKRVAFIALNFATDPNYEIQLRGTATGDNDASNVVPNWLQIDNLANNALLTLTFGSVVFRVQPYSRQNFPIDGTMQFATVNIPSGSASLWLSEQRLSDDAENSVAAGAAANAALLAAVQQLSLDINALGVLISNQSLLISAQTTAINNMNTTQTANINALIVATNAVTAATNALIAITVPNFPLKGIFAATAQVAGDNGKSILFSFGAAGNYTLLTPAIAGAGWKQDISNPGNFAVTVVPSAGVTINNVFTNASGMVLRPGDEGSLQTDGVTWTFKGTLSFTQDMELFSAMIPIVGNHRLGKIPTRTEVIFIWVTALGTPDGPYGEGSIVELDRVDKFLAAGGAATSSAYSVVSTATQLTTDFNWVGAITHNISNVAGSAAGFNISAAAGGDGWFFRTTAYAVW
jgi:hypothetical protein